VASIETGTHTFLFTDIEGSASLWEEHAEAMRVALRQHDDLLRFCIESHGGRVFKTVGDAFCATFGDPRNAVGAALDCQQWLPALSLRTPQGEIPLKVRMALHTGVAEERDGDYFGPSLNRVARLLAIGHGGQVLLSLTSAELVRDNLPGGASLRELGKHRLRDLGRPETVFALLHPELPADFPPLRSVDEPLPVHNLPQQPTPMVGRTEEVRDWSGLIRARSRRLFTLTGFGGIGKTRVALQIAETLLPNFPDGVWWCNLEQARDAEDAVAGMVQALGMVPQAAPSVKEQLLRHLRHRNTLLVLDNLEQVSGGSSLLQELLAETREAVYLITSRRTMDLRGEVVLDLAPLPAPESATLFAERAAECRPGFVIEDENRTEVRELCHRLEGVPLAIELAAARVGAMPPRQILSRLAERFRLLQSRSPDLNERQRALRGAIDWSYQLLSEEERLVFAQLSAFSGGFTLEDAEAVCEAFDVFESVLSLRQQSLFRAEGPEGSQQPRFVMLDALRDYAAEKLGEVEGAEAAVRLRHAHHFLRFARERLSRLRTPEEPEALLELAKSEGNLRAALDWAASGADHQLFAELALVAGSALQRRGFVQRAAEILQAGLDAAPAHAESLPQVAAGLLLERAGLHYDFGEAEACARLTSDARPLFEQVENAQGIARVENLLGQAAMAQKQFRAALSHFERARELFHVAGDRIGVAIALNNLGLAERRDRSGSPEEIAARQERARDYLNEALELRRALDDRRGLAEALNNLGVLAFELGRFDDARLRYLEALRWERQVGNLHGVGVALANLGEVAGIQGSPGEGVRLLAAAERALTEVGSPVAATVREMLEAAGAAAGWSAGALQEQRSMLQRVSIADCCDWALDSAADLPPTE
jgi:predicted ATPase/class 3 adenylate cyclase